MKLVVYLHSSMHWALFHGDGVRFHRRLLDERSCLWKSPFYGCLLSNLRLKKRTLCLIRCMKQHSRKGQTLRWECNWTLVQLLERRIDLIRWSLLLDDIQDNSQSLTAMLSQLLERSLLSLCSVLLWPDYWKKERIRVSFVFNRAVWHSVTVTVANTRSILNFLSKEWFSCSSEKRIISNVLRTTSLGIFEGPRKPASSWRWRPVEHWICY